MRRVAIVVLLPLVLSGCAMPWLKSSTSPVPETSPEPAPAAAPVIRPEVSPASGHEAQAASDVWQRLADNFSWTWGERADVEREIARLGRRPASFQRVSAKAEPFLWYIAEVLDQRKLPAELALLPLVESHYAANAVSPFGAAGLWQFMPATGATFGLKQTRWYDGRFDVVSSTDAALDYLESLYRQFDGDWLLAIAAYNCGPATVRRALTRSRARNFWSIAKYLPAETRSHVPRLLAAVTMITAPATYGIELHPIGNEPYFRVVDLGGPLDLTVLSATGQWPRADFKRLNPAFRRRYTDPDGPFEILAPDDLADGIVALLAEIPPERRLPTHIHVVQRGDTLSDIAARYDTSINSIRRENNIRGSFIKAGRELLVPTNGSAAATPGKMRDQPGSTEYVVASGDSLSTIASRYGTSSRDLAQRNGLTMKSTLQPGQVLNVSLRQTATNYEVSRGDSLWNIARRFDVSVADLRRWNSLRPQQTLQPGQTLIVSHPPADGLRKI